RARCRGRAGSSGGRPTTRQAFCPPPVVSDCIEDVIMEANNTQSDSRGLNRRDFVAAAAATAAFAACGGMLGGCASGPGGASAGPESGASLPPEADPNGTVDVGTVADYPNDGVYDKFAVSERMYVVRRG